MKNLYLMLLISLLIINSCSDSSTNPTGEPYVRIYYIIPNPDGNDDYNEEFCIRNTSEVFFKGAGETYYIKDREGVKWDLDLGNLMPGQTQVFKSYKSAQLLNSGDTVSLYNTNNQLVQTVSYTNAKDGDTIWVK